MIDVHAHILPKVDDGSASSADSVAMLRLQAQQGITQVIATPHFYPQNDTPKRFLERRAAAMDRLAEVLPEEGIPEIYLGAEVYYYPQISSSEELSLLTMGKSRYILIEMPHGVWTSQMYQVLEDIYTKQRLIPVIAHIDRYIGPFHNRGILKNLERLPVLIQANASFFLGGATRGLAMRMLQHQQIHLLGSDCHNLTTRKPNLGSAVEAIRQKCPANTLEWICEHENNLLQTL